ncbi:MAG TPA: hypothetical protein VM802_01815 [Chitinophaga sp.]|uniref:hypothetical protein n=1 Tax=Chitinophaga sp. TaxID=1869181 RepID=UPI002C408670|nr:hypothetical protein [Chitinophaga sp.]HVI43569.1 hypothetical protein [Chitinophaga sp.]
MNRLLNLFILLAIVFSAACKKDQNPRLPDGLEKSPIPLVQIVKGSDASIGDVNTFKGNFNVGLLFPNDIKPKKMDVVVALNANYDVVKVLQADVTTYPTSITVTAQQLAALFGKNAADLVSGDFFEIGADVTLNSGLVVTMFSKANVANPYGPDAPNYPGSSLQITYTKK